MNKIHLNRDGQSLGPFDEAQCRTLLAQGFLAASDQAWHKGRGEWLPLEQFLALTSVLPQLRSVEQTTTTATRLGPDSSAAPSEWKEDARLGSATPMPPVASQPRPVSGAAIAGVLVGFVALWKFGVESILIPFGLLSGLALCAYGLASIMALRRAFYRTSMLREPAANTQLAEAGSACGAFVFALLTLLLWVPLFTFGRWIFWSSVNYGEVGLWFLNSWFYGYLYLLGRRLRR